MTKRSKDEAANLRKNNDRSYLGTLATGSVTLKTSEEERRLSAAQD